jgi:hypothetical protein
VASTQHFAGPLLRSGRLHYVEVPADEAVSLGSPGHAPVAGKANGKGVRAVVTMDAKGGFRILLNAAARDRLGITAGDNVECYLTPDPTDAAPPIPDDLDQALDAIDGSRPRWDALQPAHQRELLIWIAESRGTANRSRRIARTLARIWE